jgi:hypothetical protein
MSFEVRELAGVRVLVCDADGPPIGEPDATDLIGEAYAADAAMVAIPVSRLAPGFLDLSTRIAGELLQKLINYHRRVALVGDVSATVAKSQPLADFVRESNRGRHVWFVDDLAELEARLVAAE